MIHHITVTADDIAQGEAGNCKACPIASAMRRELLRGVEVLAHTWCFSSGEPTSRRLPTLAVEFIKSFDSGEPVKPFSFTVATLP